jgi:hypothetical protein
MLARRMTDDVPRTTSRQVLTIDEIRRQRRRAADGTDARLRQQIENLRRTVRCLTSPASRISVQFFLARCEARLAERQQRDAGAPQTFTRGAAKEAG